MMIFKQVPLYRFLDLCLGNRSIDSPKILDCGAGGNMPPLALFAMSGFETYGVEIDLRAIAESASFEKKNNLSLNICKGDMTQLDFQDDYFDCVYSYNSIFHMTKENVEKSINELKCVLKPGGLMFVNFLSVDDFRCGEGPCLGNNQYEQMDDEPVIHSYYDYTEADEYFVDMETLIKETRVIERVYEGQKIRQGFIDYILKK